MRNDEIAQKLHEFHQILDGHARASSAERDAIRRDLTDIRESLDRLEPLAAQVGTLVEMVDAYKAAGTIGRGTKWIAGFILVCLSAWAAIKGWIFPNPGGGQ